MSTTSTTESLTSHREPASYPNASKGWAYAGVGAAVAGIVGLVGSSMSGIVYDESVAGDALAITEKLADKTVPILVFHTAAMVAALLLLVFAAGLRRRLAELTPSGSLIPAVASSGLMLVSVALLMGTALTTEFVFGVQDPDLLVPETAVFFGHWIGTVPWVWVGAGVAALALGVAGRRFGGVPSWLVWVSLVLGGLTVLFGISPLQYMAGMTGPLWLLVASLGLLKRP